MALRRSFTPLRPRQIAEANSVECEEAVGSGGDTDTPDSQSYSSSSSVDAQGPPGCGLKQRLMRRRSVETRHHDYLRRNHHKHNHNHNHNHQHHHHNNNNN